VYFVVRLFPAEERSTKYTKNTNKPGDGSLLSSANTTKPDHIGQAFNSNAKIIQIFKQTYLLWSVARCSSHSTSDPQCFHTAGRRNCQQLAPPSELTKDIRKIDKEWWIPAAIH